jgi:N utilization substance protein B
MAGASRSRSRELVLCALYACEHGSGHPLQTFEDLAERENLGERGKRFARELFTLVVENAPWADDHIRRLAQNWELGRIAVIDHLILRMAMVELEKCPDVPVKVVLNEAIELAKKFSTTESPAFVNGILDRYVKVARPGQ